MTATMTASDTATLTDLRRQLDAVLDEQQAELKPIHDREHDDLQRAEEDYHAARERVLEIHRQACGPIEARYRGLVQAIRRQIQEESSRLVVEREDCGGDLRAEYERPIDGHRAANGAGEAFFGL